MADVEIAVGLFLIVGFGLLLAWLLGAFKPKSCNPPPDSEKEMAGGDNVLTFKLDKASGNCVADSCVSGYTPSNGVCVADYEYKGSFVLDASDSGWKYYYTNDTTLDNCFRMCSTTPTCIGLSIHPARSGDYKGKMQCRRHYSDYINNTASNYEACKDNPWDIDICKDSKIPNAKFYKKITS